MADEVAREVAPPSVSREDYEALKASQEELVQILKDERRGLKVELENLSAIKGWLPGISDIKTRETIRQYIMDLRRRTRALWRRRQNMVREAKRVLRAIQDSDT